VTAGPSDPVARQPQRAPHTKPHPPPSPRRRSAAAPSQGVRRGRSGATRQRRLRRPQQCGPGLARTLAAGWLTYGVTRGVRRGADKRAGSRAGRPRRPARWDGGTRSRKPGPVGIRRATWRDPRSGPRRTSGYQPPQHERSGPSASRGAGRSPGRPRLRPGRREP